MAEPRRIGPDCPRADSVAAVGRDGWLRARASRGRPQRSRACTTLVALGALGAMAGSWREARGDEGGTSFWVPGQYAANQEAALPTPGWSMPVALYYYSGRAPASASAGQGAIAPGARTQVSQMSLSPTYAPRARVLGGQLALSVSFGAGRDATEVDGGAGQGAQSDTVRGFTDVVPTASLGWQRGPHSWMAYLTGNLPVGSYDSRRLSNLGIGHAALDAGGAYTYEDAASQRSLSVAGGVTYNYENPDTDYRNGVDSHLGVSAMLALSDAWRAGLTGYAYYQLTGDGGAGNACGACKSRVAGIGPQFNVVFGPAEQPWSFNLRSYYEFGARNRFEGYAVFATLAVPLGGPPGGGATSR